jgi:hypothetical protein
MDLHKHKKAMAWAITSMELHKNKQAMAWTSRIMELHKHKQEHKLAMPSSSTSTTKQCHCQGAGGRGMPHGITECIGVDANPGGGSISLLEPGALAAIAAALAVENPSGDGAKGLFEE